MPPIGPSSELTHPGRPYELILLVSTVLVVLVFVYSFTGMYLSVTLSVSLHAQL